MAWNLCVAKICRELWHLKKTQKGSGCLRNRPLGSIDIYLFLLQLIKKKIWHAQTHLPNWSCGSFCRSCDNDSIAGFLLTSLLAAICLINILVCWQKASWYSQIDFKRWKDALNLVKSPSLSLSALMMSEFISHQKAINSWVAIVVRADTLFSQFWKRHCLEGIWYIALKSLEIVHYVIHFEYQSLSTGPSCSKPD